MHVVEVRRDGDALSGPMAEMREWLDDKHIELTLFRLSLIPGGTVFQFEFRLFTEAAVFAHAFSGHIIGEAAPRAAA
jgi:hypothetical protein